MQSGRHPLHVNAENEDQLNYNPGDPVSGYQGIPLGMVTLPKLLAPAGYTSYFYGKWDVGVNSHPSKPRITGAHYGPGGCGCVGGGWVCGGADTVALPLLARADGDGGAHTQGARL